MDNVGLITEIRSWIRGQVISASVPYGLTRCEEFGQAHRLDVNLGNYEDGPKNYEKN